jgi:hypothetical protein
VWSTAAVLTTEDHFRFALSKPTFDRAVDFVGMGQKLLFDHQIGAREECG